jgi:hypothetical protein
MALQNALNITPHGTYTIFNTSNLEEEQSDCKLSSHQETTQPCGCEACASYSYSLVNVKNLLSSFFPSDSPTFLTLALQSAAGNSMD